MKQAFGLFKYVVIGCIIPIVLVVGIVFDYLEAIITGYKKMWNALDLEMQEAKEEASKSFKKAKEFYSSEIVKKYKDGEL